MKRKVITVDGLAGTGKTTIAKLLAEKLGFKHLNSGLLYRALGHLAIKYNVSLSDEAELSTLLTTHTIFFSDSRDLDGLIIDGENISRVELMKGEISHASSVASQYGKVRNKLIDLQRECFSNNNIVAEGRDMGTVIFPDAGLKFYLTVATDTKVKRRFEQLKDMGALSGDLWEAENQIKIDILDRDTRDTTRAVSPTLAAKDAIVIDNSSDSLTQIVQTMYDAAALRGMTEAG